VTPVQYATTIDGWMRPAELAWLAETAAALPTGATWIECGVWHGRSWSCAALALPAPATIVAIDIFGACDAVQSEAMGVPVGHDPEVAFEAVRRDVMAQRPALSCPVIRSPSVVALDLLACNVADVVFIDSDHTAETTALEIMAARRILKRGGLLCGHDGGDGPVREALWATLGGVELVDAGSIWAHRV